MSIFLKETEVGLESKACFPVKEVGGGIYAPLACYRLGKIIEPPEVNAYRNFVTEYRSIFKEYTPTITNSSGQISTVNGMGVIYSPEYGDYVVSTQDTSTGKSINGSSYAYFDSRLKRKDVFIPVSIQNPGISNVGAFKVVNPNGVHIGMDNEYYISARYKCLIFTDGPIKPVGILSVICGSTTDTCPSISNNTTDYTDSIRNKAVYAYTSLPNFPRSNGNFTIIRRVAVNEGAGQYGDMQLWLAVMHIKGSVIGGVYSSPLQNIWYSNPLIRLHRTDTSKKFIAAIHSQTCCFYAAAF